MKRAVATLTFYIYGETEEEIKSQSKEICENFNEDLRKGEAEIESLHLKPWGKLGELKNIDL